MADLVTVNTLLSLIALWAVYWLKRSNTAPTKDEGNDGWWKRNPVVGLPKGMLPWLRSLIKSLTRTRAWVFEGYSKFSKSNMFFTVPTLDKGRVLVVPPEQVKAIYRLPDTVLDAMTTANMTIQNEWTVWDEKITHSGGHVMVKLISNRITRNLSFLTPIIAREIENGFAREWGSSKTEWKDISLWTSSLNLIAGAANGAFFGEHFFATGRDMGFLTRLQDHAKMLFFGSIVINCTPKPLRFLSGYFIGWIMHFLFLRAARYIMPTVKDRLRQAERLRADPNYDWTPPQDGLQWGIEEAYESGDPEQLDPTRVALRMVYLNDVSMHSTSYTALNVILDLASLDPSHGYIDALRAESGRALKAAGGSWTRAAVNELKLIDSTVRESMRLTPFNSVGITRTVIDPHGISVKQGDTETKIPPGTVLGIPVEPIHYDESFYPNAHEFYPFRFVSPEVARGVLNQQKTAAKADGSSATGIGACHTEEKTSVTIDDSFVTFGIGKHACPGRFFALNEIKILVAHMVLHYDIEHLKGGRAKMTPILWLNAPLFNRFNVRIRRRTPAELA
ncbi:ent-kaurene oxidase [Apiospora marii]|uniref:ent-kaurene oxidase n=1 Tax=Apiospora marii TaxID=335849 RepID=UPI00312DB35A